MLPVAFIALMACQRSPPATGEAAVDLGPADLRINELLASNALAVVDPLGGSADFLELVDRSGEGRSLDGWGLLLEGEDPVVLDDLYVPPGGHLVLWADGDPSLGPDHLPFVLPAIGGRLVLSDPEGDEHDAVAWPQQAPDTSAVRAPDGADTWALSALPTPGEANIAFAPEAPTASEAAELPEPCGLWSDLADPNLWEGDEVDLRVSCASGTALVQRDLALVGAPQGAVLEGSTLTWRTTGAEGGRHDLVFAVRDAGATTQVPEAGTVTLWLADDPEAPGAELPDPEAYTEEWGLPVIHLDPYGELHRNYVSAEVSLHGRTVFGEAKIRGASSTAYPKVSYTLDFDGLPLQVEGWGEVENLVLTTTFDDNSYLRAKLVFDLWAAMGEHRGIPRIAPRTFHVVLYIEGVWQGLYLATDHVKEELAEASGLRRDGSLYKAVDHDANFYEHDAEGAPKLTWHQGYEQKEGPAGDLSDLGALVEWAATAELGEVAREVDAWVDRGDLVDWLVLVRTAELLDSAGKNVYLYAEEPGESAFRLTPWDFNASLGQDWKTRRVDPLDLDDYADSNRLFAALQDSPEGRAEVWARYAELRQEGAPLSDAWLAGWLDAHTARIAPSAERDEAAWGAAYRSFERWAADRDEDDDWQDFEGELAYLRDWLEARVSSLDALAAEEAP